MRRDLNSHLWDYEPETVTGLDATSAPSNLNSHLWDYEPETPPSVGVVVSLVESQFPFMGLWTWNQIFRTSTLQSYPYLNSHLWDYEPETGETGSTWLQVIDLNSHLWDYEPETAKLLESSLRSIVISIPIYGIMNLKLPRQVALWPSVLWSQFPFMGLWTWNSLYQNWIHAFLLSQFPFMGLWTWNGPLAEGFPQH